MNPIKNIRRFATVLVLAACAAVSVPALLTSCSKVGTEKIASGKVLDSDTLALTLTNQGINNIEFTAVGYAEVRDAAIPRLVETFRADLSRAGLGVSDISGRTGYDARFNCTAFADYFTGRSCAMLMVELWNSNLPVSRPAIFPFIYTPDKGPLDSLGRRIRHDVVLVVTDVGVTVIEPQTGERKVLTLVERGSGKVRA